MPTYDYKCAFCGHQEEISHKMSDPVVTTCSRCKRDTMAKMISQGYAMKFMGSGFYCNDYAKEKK